jgi:predicted permease
MEISRAIVGPGYLHALRTPLIAGREFGLQDTEDTQRVAIVNQAFVDRYWPGKNAIGMRVGERDNWYTVVGIAGNAKYRRVVYPPEPVVFLPLFQAYYGEVIVHVRAAGDPRALAQALENAVHELNPDLPVYNVTTLESSMLLGSIFERLAGAFAGAFGLLALLLAAVGIYGVVDYTTRQRTREIGVRMALGARPWDICRLVLSQGVRLAIYGLILGLGVSVVATRFLRSLLFGVSAMDVPTIASVSILLCILTLAACFFPARRAAKVNPIVALRYE